jgi:hypothetical protein
MRPSPFCHAEPTEARSPFDKGDEGGFFLIEEELDTPRQA